jgi:hypothetical protein
MLALASATTCHSSSPRETMDYHRGEILEGLDSMLFTLGGNMHLEWRMFSYDHWSRRANADNIRQMSRVGGNEARGDGGRPRTRR